jgi:hypothetical protein
LGLTTPYLHLPEIDLTRLPQDDWPIATLGLDFGQSSAMFKLQTVSGIKVSVPMGLDGVYRVTTSHFGTLVAQGKWETATRFILLVRRLEQGTFLSGQKSSANIPYIISNPQRTRDFEKVRIANY